MKTNIFLIVLFMYFFFPKTTQAADFFFPMTHTKERATVKPFGLLINSAFYKGKETLFPSSRPSGFHTGVDLEALLGEEEKIVPVYAISDGTILYAGKIDGYGGVILLSLSQNDLTALYGHVKTDIGTLKKGDTVAKGSVLTYLGDAFSNETGGERKHLHFGIYRGKELYFKGHETTKKDLDSKWTDPLDFLDKNGAQEPGSMTNKEFKMKDTTVVAKADSQKIQPSKAIQEETNPSFFKKIIRWIQNLFI